MQFRIEHPTHISPDELDRYLRDGWFRLGQRMITCRFISGDGDPRSVLWSRTNLAGYKLSRSNRRLMRRNRQRYSVHEGPLVMDEEHEAVYRRYLDVAPGRRSATLAESLLGDKTEDRFATRELAIRDESGTLVGFSAFDLGLESLQSLMGVYDPAHQSASLGYWSLLLEVEHAIELGLRYHYAGYVVPNGGGMDYKLRVGQIEFFDQNECSWRPWEEHESVELPGQELDRMLRELQSGLQERSVPSTIESYRWFEAPAWSPALEALLAEPRVVLLGDRSSSPHMLVTWSFDTKCYGLVLCMPVAVGSATDSERDEVEMWLVQDSVELSDDAAVAAVMVAEWWRSPVRVVRSPIST